MQQINITTLSEALTQIDSWLYNESGTNTRRCKESLLFALTHQYTWLFLTLSISLSLFLSLSSSQSFTRCLRQCVFILTLELYFLGQRPALGQL